MHGEENMESKEMPSQKGRLAIEDVPFQVPEGIYLLNHSVGCLPIGTPEERFFAAWREKGGDAWPLWLEMIDEFRQAIADLLGAQIDEICPQANLSSGFSKVLHSLPNRGRKVILMHEESFPSLGFIVRQAPQYEIRLARGNQWEIDEQVDLVLLTHVLSNSSQLFCIEKLAKEAKRHGAYVAVDVAQSAGLIPIDVKKWEADFVIGSCIKWLCGGPGAGFLWVKRETNLSPIDVGWFSHEDPFAFDLRDFRYAKGALRFWGGTPNVLPFLIAEHSVKLLLKIGIDNILEHNRILTDQLAELFEVNPKANRGGTITVPCSRENELRLQKCQARYDKRESVGFRLSPHIYNTLEEIDRI